jgi:hypothetical protein
MPYKSLLQLVVLACVPASAFANPAPDRDKTKQDVLAKGQTVILGTWNWKIDGNKLGGNDGADFWWEQLTNTERQLVPKGGAGWAIIQCKAFEKVTRDDLAKMDFSTDKLSGKFLAPGTAVAIRTGDGKFAKLQVIRYRELHDFSFPEAKHLTPDWIKFVLGQPNIKEYHLEVNWVLYKQTK